MKKLPFLFLLLLLIACKDKDNQKDNLPSCIQELIDDTTGFRSIKRVKTQTIEGELHYWLNTEATYVDGAEFIVNESCEELCFFCGECLPPPCTYDYDDADWETIWEE